MREGESPGGAINKLCPAGGQSRCGKVEAPEEQETSFVLPEGSRDARRRTFKKGGRRERVKLPEEVQFRIGGAHEFIAYKH